MTMMAGQDALVRVRLPLFVFFFAEELSRPFFPIFVRSLHLSFEGLSPEVVVSLPMMLFMLVVAFAQPLGGPWVERFGARRLMLAGAIVGASGLALTATCGKPGHAAGLEVYHGRGIRRSSSWPARDTSSRTRTPGTVRGVSPCSSAAFSPPRSADRRSAASSPTGSAIAGHSRSVPRWRCWPPFSHGGCCGRRRKPRSA